MAVDNIPPSKFGAATKFLNLKKAFDDAVRQNQWKMEQDAQQQRSGAYQSFYNSGISQGVMDVPGAVQGYNQAMGGGGAATMTQPQSEVPSMPMAQPMSSPDAGTLPNGEKNY